MLKLKNVGSKDPQLYTLSEIKLGEVFFYYIVGVSTENQGDPIYYLRTDCGAVHLNGGSLGDHEEKDQFTLDRCWAIAEAEIHIHS